MEKERKRRVNAGLVVAGLVVALAGCKRRPAEAPAVVPSTTPTPAAGDAAAAKLPANYDPALLVQNGMDPLEVFLKEPRNDDWASEVEAVIGGQIRSDLTRMVPAVRGMAMRCRTLGCLFVIDAPKDNLEAAGAVVNLVTLGPITVNAGLTPEGRAQVLFFTAPRFADPVAFTAWYRRVRGKTLKELRDGTKPNPLPVPPVELPLE